MEFNTWLQMSGYGNQSINNNQHTMQTNIQQQVGSINIPNLSKMPSIPYTTSLNGTNLYHFDSIPDEMKTDLTNQGFKFYQDPNGGIFAYKPQNWFQQNASTIGLGLQGIGAITNLLTSLEALKGVKEQIKLLKQQRKQQAHDYERLRNMRNSITSKY